MRLDTGPHDVGVVGVRRQLPDALERGVGVTGERQGPLGALGPRPSPVGGHLDGRPPVPRLDAGEHRRATLARVDGNGRDLAHVDSVHYAWYADKGPATTLSTGSPDSMVCTCRRTSARARGRIARVAPPTCGVMRTPGVVHSG